MSLCVSFFSSVYRSRSNGGKGLSKGVRIGPLVSGRKLSVIPNKGAVRLTEKDAVTVTAMTTHTSTFKRSGNMEIISLDGSNTESEW